MNTPDPTPFTDSTAQYHYGWCRRVRSALLHDGQACRLSQAGLSIEAKSLHTNQWQPIMLPNGGTQFYSVDDRLRMFAMVTGHQPIPELVAKEEAAL